MIQIYGSPRTSASRCYLTLEEIGIPYEAAPLDMMEKREHKSASYLKLNPNGKVPCLVDGDFVLWESVAINTYLAEKYKPELLGKTPEEKGLVQQWSLWALSELQAPLVDLIIQTVFTPEPKRNAEIIAKAREKVPPLLTILDSALANKDFMVGKSLTLADLNMASVVNIAPNFGFAIEEYMNLNQWMQKMKGRPAFQRLLNARGGR